MSNKPFSKDLEIWLNSKGPKTVGDLQDVFGEKSFAILFLIFMFIPALPIPTGGITTVILVPTVIVGATQMIFGRRSLWLPWFMKRTKLGDKSLKQGLPFMIKRIQWLEKFSRPRLSNIFDKALFRSLAGFSVVIFALGVGLAPPFSWLDTLPAMAAVLVALSIILEDISFFIAGLITGTVGVALIIVFFDLVINFVQKLF